MHSETRPASTETLLRAVADPERRAVLRHLQATDSPAVDVDDLADAVASRGRPTDGEMIAIELYHTHLPVLADAEVIEFDRERDSVAYCGDDHVETLLQFISDRLE